MRTSVSGALEAQVLGADGKVVAESEPLRGDKTLARIAWKGRADLAAFAGQPVRFRFRLRSGSLYAFWVSPDESGASHGYVAGGGPGFTGARDTVGIEAYAAAAPILRGN